jgi:NADH-quinone oxidoreductase subunit H
MSSLILFDWLILVICLLISVAFLTLLERKFMANVQRRRGPNLVGILGLLQPLADGLKLIFKEMVLPFRSNKLLFIVAPIITFTLSMLCWSVIPLNLDIVLINLNLGLLLLLALSSLNVYGIVIAGWSSNSSYSFLGCLRSAAQMISYEIGMGFVFLCIALPVGSFNLMEIVIFQRDSCWFIFSNLPLGFIFLITLLAETNRPPFDLPEAEAELVAGYNVEYSSSTFALFFLGEYANILLMSVLFSLLFLGGWYGLNIFFKIYLVVFFIVYIRAALPRFRYDQLMYWGWKCFIPLTFAYFIFIINFYYFY